ncbi:MAG: histidine phosphatase family protein [Faecalicoccus sp.]|nr:histidine phosphatase family protein [Faecalicoccus sp.]
MDFYIVRHGQTLFNVKKRIQGWSDSPLTVLGIEQAKSLGKRLDTARFKAAYCSTSERARDTLDAILDGRELRIHSSKGFKEVSFGRLEGEKIADVFKDGKTEPTLYYEYGGEKRDTAAQRFFTELKKIYAKEQSGDILVVSHGSIIREVLSNLDSEIHDSKESTFVLVPNCSVSIISYDGNQFILKQKPSTE